MKTSQAATKIRSAIKREKINPKGKVRVVSGDYYSEVEVDLRGIYGESRENIEDAIDALPDNIQVDVI